MEKKLTTVFFQDTEGHWLKNAIDLGAFRSKFPLIGARAVLQPRAIYSEMFLNIFELCRLGLIKFENDFAITDYGGGKSNVLNFDGLMWAANVDGFTVAKEYGSTFDEVVENGLVMFKTISSFKRMTSKAVEAYDYGITVTVRNFDTGINAYEKPLEGQAEIVFCNSLLAHTPLEDISSTLTAIESAGKYVFLTIPLRPSANYVVIAQDKLFKNAESVSEPPKDAIVLQKAENGYLLAENVCVLSKNDWKRILGNKWTLLPSSDYTSVCAVNFTPSAGFVDKRRQVISDFGFADYLPFPTPMKSLFEKDSVLLRRSAELQPLKHVMKLEELKSYPQSAFKEKEQEKSRAFLQFIGLMPDENGNYDLASLKKDYVEQIIALEKEAKSVLTGTEKASKADAIVSQRADEIIAEHNNR